MNFVIKMFLLKDQKQNNNYNAIFVILNQPTKIIYYIATKTTITNPN